MSYCYWLQVGQMPCCACSRCWNGQFDYFTAGVLSFGMDYIIDYWLVVLGLKALWDSISVYIGPSPRERERKKSEMIDERKNVQTTRTRTYCSCSRSLPYSYPNK